jgi:hypothetical protein
VQVDDALAEARLVTDVDGLGPELFEQRVLHRVDVLADRFGVEAVPRSG